MEDIIENKPIVQCVISNPDIDKIIEFKKFLSKKLKMVKIVNESKRLKNFDLKPSKNYYCDITSKDVSKGRAVLETCKYLNLKKEEIIAIGDGENDISMFELTPNSIAMENAVQNVKKQAKYVTLSNDEDGVANVLEKL